MNLHSKKHNSIVSLFALLLFLFFLGSAITLVLIGTHVYGTIAQNMQSNFSSNTSLSYIAEKIRQNDTQNSISIQNINEQDVLVLKQVYNQVPYCTYIYNYEDALMELFVKEGQSISFESGNIILQDVTCTFEKVDNSLYHFTSTDDLGLTQEIFVSPHCSESTR